MFKTGPVKGSTESRQPSIKQVIEAMHRKSEAESEIEKLEARLNELKDVSNQPLSLALDSQDQIKDILPSKRRQTFPEPAPKKPKVLPKPKPPQKKKKPAEKKKYKNLFSFWGPKKDS